MTRRCRRCIRQPFAARGKAIEKPVDRRDLCRGRVEMIDFMPERLAAGEPCRVPAQVLARGSHAGLFAIERIMIVQMLEDDVADLLDHRRRQMLAVVEEVANLAKDPGSALCGASDHDGVGAGASRAHRAPFPRESMSPFAVTGNRDRALDLANRVVLDRADKAALARPAMHRQCRDACVLGDPGDPHRVAVFAVPAGADLQRHRHARPPRPPPQEWRRPAARPAASAEPAATLHTFFAGQPMLISMICAPRSTL